jgi:DNA-binding transcriptional regulator YiaG
MNFNSLIKEAVAKGAARTVRKPMAALRHDVAALKHQMAALRRTVRELQRVVARKADGLVEAESTVEVKRKRRPTGDGIKKMRTALGLTQSQFGKLLGVSSLSVSKWERAKGPVTVRTRTLVAIRKARGLGKREALNALQG